MTIRPVIGVPLQLDMTTPTVYQPVRPNWNDRRTCRSQIARTPAIVLWILCHGLQPDNWTHKRQAGSPVGNEQIGDEPALREAGAHHRRSPRVPSGRSESVLANAGSITRRLARRDGRPTPHRIGHRRSNCNVYQLEVGGPQPPSAPPAVAPDGVKGPSPTDDPPVGKRQQVMTDAMSAVLSLIAPECCVSLLQLAGNRRAGGACPLGASGRRQRPAVGHWLADDAVHRLGREGERQHGEGDSVGC